MSLYKHHIKIDKFLKEKDEEIVAQYHEEGPWGLTLSIDLHECDPDIIRSQDKMKKFTKALIKFIGMRAYGETYIMDFGDNPEVSGISMFQFIETSCISGHFANKTNSAYLDIFSCREFNPHEAAAFCKKFFQAREMRIHVAFRE